MGEHIESTQVIFWEHSAKGIREAAPLVPTGHLLYKAILLRLRHIADLSNIEK